MVLGKVRRGVAVVVVTHDDGAAHGPLLDALAERCGPQDRLVFVDNGSPAARRAELRAFVDADPEHRELMELGANRGFAAAANRGLARADRPYVAVLHPDTAPGEGWIDALLAPVLADEAAGGRLAAVAACAELAAGEVADARHATGACRLFRRDALVAAGGWDEAFFFGAEDRELSHRLREAGHTVARVGGVPLAALPRPEPPPPDALRRRNLRLQAEQLLAERLHDAPESVRRDLAADDEYAADRSRVSVVIPVFDNLALTRAAVESVFEHTRHDFELVLVDNGSREDVVGYAQTLAALKPNVRWIRNERNEGFGYASNQGLHAATGRYLVLLNNDVRVTPGWLSRLIALARLDPKIGLVAPRSNRVSGPQLVADVPYEDGGDAADYAVARAREQAGRFQLQTRVAGLCMLMPREVMEEVGGFDPCFWIGNFEDDDLCLRVNRRGFVCAVADDAFVHHEGSATWKDSNLDYQRLLEDNWRWFRHKWEYDGPLGERYPARDLALRLPFSSERDAIPVDPAAVFSPNAAPLALADVRATRVLLFAEAGETVWRERLREYVATVGPEDDATLVLRIEPPTPDVLDEVTLGIEAIVAAAGGADLPDVLIETTPLTPRRRGGLYTAATILLADGGHRDALHRREATACGLPVAESVAESLALAPT